ncbi:MAG: glycosyltransferase, partial [candidate division WOR-3 bacterium]
MAETFSFISTVLVVFNYWDNKDIKPKSPPRFLSDIDDVAPEDDRPIKIDVFITTYNEDEELVRYSVRDAMQMTYPFKDVEIKVWVLDDGRRESMRQVAEEEGANYLTRANNAGYKAGNLKNGLENSDGDLFVILDADTR